MGNNKNNYTLSSFIFEKCNEHAYLCVKEILRKQKNKDWTYNPVYIFGESGLGKTHLLYVIKNELEKNNMKIIYTTAKEFMNDFFEALTDATLSQFRNKYTNTEVLLIDDIHDIAGKKTIEEEFRHIFNQLHNENKLIVLSGNKYPTEIELLNPRLATRFCWGISTCLEKTDYKKT